MKISIKTFITDEPGMPFMGPGPLRLLEKISEFKSINQAAGSMGLSYVKALNILNRLEKCLGEKLLERKRGGNERGGTQLTPYAEKFIWSYKGIEEKINGFAQTEFQEFQREFRKTREDEKD